MATFDFFVHSLKEEFGEQNAGFKFEVFCKWFLENDPEWSKVTLNSIPSLIQRLSKNKTAHTFVLQY